MIFIRIAIAFFMIFLFGKIVDFTKSQQEKCESLSFIYVALGILNALLVTTVMILIFTFISGNSPAPIVSIFSVFLAIFLGFEFANWITSDKTNYLQILFTSLTLAVLLWPIFYGTAYLMDLLNSKQILVAKIGIIEFSILSFFSMMMAPTLGVFTDRYL